MKNKKRIISASIILALILSVFPVSAFAYSYHNESNIKTEGNWKYYLDNYGFNEQCSNITEYTGTSDYVSIPYYLDGKDTFSVEYGWLGKKISTVKTIHVPYALNTFNKYCDQDEETIDADEYGNIYRLGYYSMFDHVDAPKLTAFDCDYSLCNNDLFSDVGGILYYGDSTKNSAYLLQYPAAKSNLTSYTAKAGTKYIAAEAFKDNKKLKLISLGNSAAELGNGAFKNCTALRDVYMHKSLTKIGDKVFYGCKNITIHCFKGSFADKYAKANYIKTKYFAVPKTPANLKLKTYNSGKNIKITWTKVKSAKGYFVTESNGRNDFAKNHNGKYDKSSEKYTAKVDYGTKQVFKVCAYKRYYGIYSCSGSKSISIFSNPEKATLILRSATGKIGVWYDAYTKYTAVQIYRKKSGEKQYKKVKTINSLSDSYKSFVWYDTGVKSGKKYTYKIRYYTTIGSTTKYGSFSKAHSARVK